MAEVEGSGTSEICEIVKTSSCPIVSSTATAKEVQLILARRSFKNLYVLLLTSQVYLIKEALLCQGSLFKE
jgi:hypothetical protein